MERKVHLVKWEVVSADKEKGGLDIRKLALLNKALLGRWIFAFEKENLWKKVISVKYGQEGLGWRTNKANGTFRVGVWKEILKETNWCWENIGFTVGNGTKIRFWTDHWCGLAALSQSFPQLYALAVQRNARVDEVWDPNFGQGGWNLSFIRAFNDWELDLVGDLLTVLRGYILTLEEVSVTWKGGRNGKFGVKEAYRLLITPNYISFSKNCIWVVRVPTKVVFFAWEAMWGKVLTLDRLQKRGWQLPNRCYLCSCEEETVNHILLHCRVVRVLLGDCLCLVWLLVSFPINSKRGVN